jgi:hypothetical protein
VGCDAQQVWYLLANAHGFTAQENIINIFSSGRAPDIIRKTE